MSDNPKNTFPHIKTGKFWFLAIIIFLVIGGISFFHISMLFEDLYKNLVWQNDVLALSLKETTPGIKNSKSKTTDENPKLSIEVKSLINVSWFTKNSYILQPEDNKTVIKYALSDSSMLGKPYDYSSPMQSLLVNGGTYYELGGFTSFEPVLKVFSVPSLKTTPKKYIFMSSVSLVNIFFFLLISQILNIFLFIFIGTRGKNLNVLIYEQKDDFLQDVEDALAKVDFNTLRELFVDHTGVYENFRKYAKKIKDTQNKLESFEESLQIQIKKMVEIITPLTEGKWDMIIDVPPGMLTPIAESINLIAEKAKSGISVIAEEEISQKVEETSEIDRTSEKNLPPSKIDSLTSVISESGTNLNYLSNQLNMIAKIIPPIFNQIEDLYERELNKKLGSELDYTPVSLKSLERLISEKDTIMGTLQNIRKMMNELIMLKNWVHIKINDRNMPNYSSQTN